MMPKQILYAQAADGVLWTSRNLEAPQPHRMTPAAFLRRHKFDVDQIRIRGASENVQLLATLMTAKGLQPGLPSVHVCTPQLQGPDPAALFAAMRELNLAGSLGGYHEIDETDAPSYVLAAAMHNSAGHLTGEAAACLHIHRAWPALSFVAGLDETAAARMLSDMLDPRWFVSLNKPNSLGRLYGFLGLTPRNIADALAGRPPGCRQARRCQTVLAAWYPKFLPEAVEDPRGFLQRVVVAEPVDHRIRGFLKASRMFVAFVRGVWLHMMAPCGRRLFVPKYFFAKPEEAIAFQLHCDAFAYRKTA